MIDPYRFASGGPNDPYFSSVSLLLHCDGSNGSTSFTDSSGSPKTVSANGNAQVDTAIVKFGTGSLKLDGSGDYLSVPANTAFNFGTGNFTIEFFVNFQGTAGQYMMDYSATNTSVISITPSTGNVFVYQGGFVLNTGSTPFSVNTWYHIALSRSGGTWTIYRDGVQYAQSTGLPSITFGSSSYSLYWGIAGNFTVPAQAHFDEIRITKGVARYTSTFTPPSAQFPNS